MTASVDLCVGWSKVGEANGATFNGVVRNLAAGEWSLSGDVAGVELQSGYTLADVDTIRVVDSKRIMFGGFVAPAATGVGGLEVAIDGAGRHFTLGGPDLWAILASRIAYPSPSTDPPWAADHDERTGIASTVAAAYLDANLGSGAIASRRITGTTIVDRVAGMSGSWSARLQPLDELVARICHEGGIIARLTVDFTGAYRIELGSPRNRTTTMVLSDIGDLVNIRQRRLGAAANYVVGGGQGLLAARTFCTSGTATGAARHEIFSDQASLSTAAELQQSTDTTLASNAATWSVHAELSAVAAQSVVLGVDYDLGDTVSAQIDNVRYALPITGATFSLTPTQQIVRPLLGDAAPTALAGLIADVSDLQSRFNTQIA